MLQTFVSIVIIIIIGAIVISETKQFKKENWVARKNNTVNEESYQKYAKFYGSILPSDKEFEHKVNAIYNLIVNKKYEDLREIARKTNCTYEECILKIRYLKNKRVIGDNYYIDHISGIIKKCSKEDKVLLKKYSPFIYGKHFQVDEMAVHLPGTTLANKKQVEKQIFKELKYLDDKDLINGVILNEVDQKITYYSIEKKLKNKDLVSITCKYCGALNDVRRGNKARCEYCDSIIESKE